MLSSFPFIAALLYSTLHVISGPDHLAAVSPLAIESEKKAWKVGIFWGLGHLSGMLLIGILFSIFKEIIPVEAISAHSEQLVGMVLIIIGAIALYRLYQPKKTHIHPHIHKKEKTLVHIHKHEHDHHHVSEQNGLRKDSSKSYSFGIGFLHGLAGVAHFILFIPVLSFENNIQVASYLTGFGIGTILAMTAYAFLLGRISGNLNHNHNPNLHAGIRLTGGLFALIIGFYWVLNA